MGFRLVDTESLHQPAELLRCDRTCFLIIPRPLETAVLKSFVQEDESVSLEVECLDPVAPSSAEQKQRPAERIQMEFCFHERGKSVDPAAKVRISARNIHVISLKIVQHDFNTVQIVRIVSSSAPG